MAQNAAHKSSHLVLTNNQTNKAVARVAQVPIVEIKSRVKKVGRRNSSKNGIIASSGNPCFLMS
jgi:hypothetical protein